MQERNSQQMGVNITIAATEELMNIDKRQNLRKPRMSGRVRRHFQIGHEVA